MNITAQQLSGEHIGKTITVQFRRSKVTGELDEIKHTRETTHADYGGRSIRTERWVTLTIGGIEHNAIGPENQIEIQEGQ